MSSQRDKFKRTFNFLELFLVVVICVLVVMVTIFLKNGGV